MSRAAVNWRARRRVLTPVRVGGSVVERAAYAFLTFVAPPRSAHPSGASPRSSSARRARGVLDRGGTRDGVFARVARRASPGRRAGRALARLRGDRPDPAPRRVPPASPRPRRTATPSPSPRTFPPSSAGGRSRSRSAARFPPRPHPRRHHRPRRVASPQTPPRHRRSHRSRPHPRRPRRPARRARPAVRAPPLPPRRRASARVATQRRAHLAVGGAHGVCVWSHEPGADGGDGGVGGAPPRAETLTLNAKPAAAAVRARARIGGAPRWRLARLRDDDDGGFGDADPFRAASNADGVAARLATILRGLVPNPPGPLARFLSILSDTSSDASSDDPHHHGRRHRRRPSAACDALAFSPCGRLLVAGARDRAAMRCWDLSTNQRVKIGSGVSGTSFLAWSPCGDYLFAAHPEGFHAVGDGRVDERVVVHRRRARDGGGVGAQKRGRRGGVGHHARRRGTGVGGASSRRRALARREAPPGGVAPPGEGRRRRRGRRRRIGRRGHRGHVVGSLGETPGGGVGRGLGLGLGAAQR